MTAPKQLNRQQRRAMDRRRVAQDGIRLGVLTLDEASILEEALEGYSRELRELHPEPDHRTTWVLERAETMRRGLYAGIHGKPWVDEHATPDMPKET